MAELEDRDRREAEFARKFGKLSAAHRKELNDLLGDPPNPENVPQEFWNKVENEARQKMLALLLLTWMDSAIQHGQDGAAAMTDGAAYALRQAMDVARGYRQHSQELLDDAVTRGDLTNRSQVHELTTKIFGPQRVARVAETETVRAQNRGADSAVRQSGRMLIAYWRHSALRKRHHAGAAFDPCPTCTPLEGKPWWEWGGLKPGDAHPHCVLPGQDVIIPGALIASAKSFYDGPAVEITLANGAVLSITPNHPILTPSGWLAANRVQVGDDLLCTTDAERIAGIVQPYHDQIPSLIEDVFHAVEQASKFHATRVPVSSEDFHGDGACIEGNVQIVNAEGFLRDRLGAAFSQEPNQLAFGDGLGQPQLLAGQSLLSFLSVSSALARDSNMGSVGLSPALASGHSGGAQQPGWRSIADVNPATPENLHDRSAADSYRFSDGIKGFTAGISADQSVDAGNLKCSNRRTLAVLNGGLPMPANLNPAISEQRHDGSEIDPSLAREFVGRFSRLIAPNEVVGVRNFQYRGHVFDLQCGPWSLYLCQGVLCKNCDCFSEYYDPVTQTFLGPSSDPAGLDAWAERFGIRSEPSPVGSARATDGQDFSESAPGWDYVGQLLIEAEWDESKHPRDDHGRFVSSGSIVAAAKDKAKLKALRARVTDPQERKKLDRAVQAAKNQKPRRRSVPASVSSTELRRRGLIVKPVAAPHDEIPAISDHDADATTETRKLMKSGTALSRQTIGSQDDHVNEVVGLTLDNGIKGVFKPDSGQQNEGLRNGMTGLWPEREAAASSLAQIIGMDDLVPETVIRDDPESGRGSFQRWADDSTVANSIEGQKKFDGPADEARAGAFDYLIGNSDRHGGNWMLGDKTKKLALIDNGLSFPDSNLHGMFNARILRHLELTGAKVPAECAAWLDKSDAIEAKLKQFGFSKNAVDSTRERLMSLAKHAGVPFGELNRRGVIGWQYWGAPDDDPRRERAASAVTGGGP